MSFLTAEWRKLAIVNYEIDPSVLTKYVPFGTELDLWNDKCYVSVVGFMFINTRLLGLKIPWHTDFEEVNLRFYVKRLEDKQWRRGVVFIKEIVPKKALSFIANTIYNENYETMKMGHVWEESMGQRTVEYKWLNNQKWNLLKIVAQRSAKEIEPDSITEFITEHYWGYAKVDATSSNEYEVIHPKWLEYPIISSDIDIDFGANYGVEFHILSGKIPDSVMLAEGSEISVENKRRIKSA